MRVHAAGLNATDWKSRAHGRLGLWGDPVVLGHDVSGVVEAVGFGVSLHRPGDEVFGMPCFPRQAGAYAEYMTAPARHFIRKPASTNLSTSLAPPMKRSPEKPRSGQEYGSSLPRATPTVTNRWRSGKATAL